MDEKRAITAISDAPFESLVAKTLYDNGWSVEKRVLDVRDLEVTQGELLLISLDVEGLSQEILNDLITSAHRTIFFHPNPHNLQIDPLLLHQVGQDPLELLSLFRGNQRTPLIHKSTPQRSGTQSEILFFASSHPNVGASFLAAQCAFELSQDQKKVLLIDGDLQSPSAYFHLGVRDLSEPQSLTPFLSAVELSTREKNEHLSLIDSWMHSFDIAIFDAGVLANLSTLERDRRHYGQMLTWALDRSHKRIIVTAQGEREIQNHKLRMDELKNFKPQGKYIEVMNKVERMNKAPENCYYLPRDERAVAKCAKEKLLMGEGAPRSPLTKAIAQFVREGLK